MELLNLLLNAKIALHAGNGTNIWFERAHGATLSRDV